ncbi:MAG: response regulator [Geothrix sp.]|jgi:CheY-like chemotaxis protein|uniref:Response regulator n=1 Tax=Candidatus Geothrix odensensis TaxID=2954440 RepID=A0A936F4Z5_9BACT|nr:response regulator [Holophagaceae bacterium]MBK8573885.1 response regulator [Candidatus Geothrix odensensis]MBK8789180.1 response regulator [Holophagaceae bacterium]MBP7618844.1 response regulator [Geothrix sp.]MCC6512748.1 response regulator [Geothrix sp.]
MSKIVVVDDSKLMRNLIQHILEQAGHEVDAWAEVTAMEVADRILASDPDLVVTDYQMPGCNGLTLARMARKAKPGLPIVVVTALHDAQVMDALKSQAVNQILHKPLKEEALLETVAEVLAQAV